MSLWLALIWLASVAICVGIFGFCRKRMADIAERVAEEVENHVNSILKAEREAETRVLDAFSNFEKTAEAIQAYQATESEIFRSPRARPLWNWSMEDLELWRKRSVDKEKASRGRPAVLATIIIILAINVAAAVITVITLNSIQPVSAAQAAPINTTGIPLGYSPLPAPSQWPVNSPSLPTICSSAPADSITNVAKPLNQDANNVSDPNATKSSQTKGGTDE
ncbi:MAG: hypothetical protein MUP16_07350 [Sedimentisphaerales bacterium]|nr:hypothetical protein [Sedimentisphaerales bacterium]